LKNSYFRTLCVFAGLTVVPTTVTQAESKTPQIRQNPTEDPRSNVLRRFFLRLHCPLASAADVFISEADSHDLDWRLLPSLAMIESSGGKAAHGNNVFGWNNGHASFPSLKAAIHQVAKTLSHGRAYRNKSLMALLRTYNPVKGYAEKVELVMNRIAPVEVTAN
jgi:hypothetical protein